jgi:arylsulfatase A-like enzyme
VRTDSPANPGKNGFDHWLSAPNFYDNDPILSNQGRAVSVQGESSIVAAEAALQWIDQVTDAEQPFFAVVWFGSPHSPHRAAPEDRTPYADQDQKLQNFLGEISGMDRAFGKLRQGLEDRDLREDTLLWYCSDNGALRGLGSTGGRRGHKSDIYDGGLLVPAILEWPQRIPRPRTTQVRCNTSDIYPTLIEISGAEIADQPRLDGVSLVPLIDGQPFRRERPMGFWDYPAKGISTPSATWMGELFKAQQAGGDLPAHRSSQQAAELPEPPFSADSFPGHAALIDGDWKLHRIQNPRGQVRWELYDLDSDPAEATDLADRRADLTDNLKPALHDWLNSVVNSLNGDDY